jgi:hypothetical protein
MNNDSMMQSRWSIPIHMYINIHSYIYIYILRWCPRAYRISDHFHWSAIERKWDLLPSHYCEYWQIACQACHSLHKYMYIENKIDIILNTTTIHKDDQCIIIKIFFFFSLNTPRARNAYHHPLSHFTFNLSLVWYETHAYRHTYIRKKKIETRKDWALIDRQLRQRWRK